MEKLKYVEQLIYTFHNSESEYIKCIVHDCKVDCLAYDSWVTIYFINNGYSPLIAFGPLHEKLHNLVYCLDQSFHKKKVFNEQLIPDIGFHFNEMHYKKSVMHEKIVANQLYNHVVWSPIIAHENIQTWLYRNMNGEIILFLASVYPFFFTKPLKKNPSYQEWIKTYKPFGRYIISQDSAQQWLKQVYDIMNLIESNSASKST